jgi:hypothetical protein
MRTTLFATVAAAALGVASMPAHATFVEENCVSGGYTCPAETHFYNDAANKGVTQFTGQVGQPTGPSVTVNTTGPVDTGAGYSTIKPVKNGTLTELIFTPADPTLFEDFSFRGQLNAGVTTPATIAVTWFDNSSPQQSNTIDFTVGQTSQDFGRLGIISLDGETLQRVVIDLVNPGFKEFKQVDFSFAGMCPIDNPNCDAGGGGSVPEPASIAILGMGLVGLGVAKRRLRLKN